jgi:hypothetical protein
MGVLLPLVALVLLEAEAAEGAKDSCVDCHSDPDLLVKNKKLYDYFQEWSASVHKQEEVSCSDCHGGNPDVDDKDAAHGGDLTGAAATSSVNFRNIPSMCGECHDEMYDAFRKSEHFEHLLAKKQEEQGPTCVTCHGSISSQRSHGKGGLRALPQRGDGEPPRDSRQGRRSAERIPVGSPLLPLHRSQGGPREEPGVLRGGGSAHPRSRRELAQLRSGEHRGED